MGVAVALVVAAALSAGGAVGGTSPTATSPTPVAVLLAPPVIVETSVPLSHGRALLDYALLVRTSDPLNPLESSKPRVRLRFVISSLGLRGSSLSGGALSSKATGAPGWCTLIGIAQSTRRYVDDDADVTARVVTVKARADNGFAQSALAYATYDPSKRGSALVRRVTGCRLP